jgi:prepilin-type N-terminal cleavage/methylation domain-containing protein
VCQGITLIELLFTMAIVCTLAVIAIPNGLRMLDEYHVANAARFLAHRLGHARLDAVRRATFVGLKFDAVSDDYVFTTVADGNANGLHTAEIVRGVDPTLSSAERLASNFSGVAFGILPGVPDADGDAVDTLDGVRVGAARILSMSPEGSSSSGTLYVHGRQRTQYAVRALGATGRVRLMKYVESARRWVDQ